MRPFRIRVALLALEQSVISFGIEEKREGTVQISVVENPNGECWRVATNFLFHWHHDGLESFCLKES
jgi:hypothetical protein